MLNYSEVEEAPDCFRVNQGGPSVTPYLRGSFAQAGGLGAGPGMAGSETPRLGGLGAECSAAASVQGARLKETLAKILQACP